MKLFGCRNQPANLIGCHAFVLWFCSLSLKVGVVCHLYSNNITLFYKQVFIIVDNMCCENTQSVVIAIELHVK